MKPIEELQKAYIDLETAHHDGDREAVAEKISVVGYWIDRVREIMCQEVDPLHEFWHEVASKV